MAPWRFAQSLGDQRIQVLQRPEPFDQLGAAIVSGMEMICGHHHKAKEDTSFSRVVYYVSVAPQLFDLLFNSERGYRGLYFRSADEGLQANARFMGLLTPRLLDWSKQNSSDLEPVRDLRFAEDSLKRRSAKVWFAEITKGRCNLCAGEWKYPKQSTAEIFNGRWENVDSPGRQAPYLTKIRIYGAFLNETRAEWDPKPDRSEQINESGWT